MRIHNLTTSELNKANCEINQSHTACDYCLRSRRLSLNAYSSCHNSKAVASLRLVSPTKVVCPVFFVNSAAKKNNNFIRVSPPAWCHPRRPSLSDSTAQKYELRVVFEYRMQLRGRIGVLNYMILRMPQNGIDLHRLIYGFSHARHPRISIVLASHIVID